MDCRVQTRHLFLTYIVWTSCAMIPPSVSAAMHSQFNNLPKHKTQRTILKEVNQDNDEAFRIFAHAHFGYC